MKRYFVFALLMLCAINAAAQTGFPPYGSFAPGGFDTVNRENLNVNFSAPIVSAPGRGTGFSLPIVYDSLVWKKSGAAWLPASGNWGWKTDVPVGSITFSSQLKSCLSGPKWDPWHEVTTRYYNYVYTDPNGTAHGFPIDFHLDATNCNYPTSPFSGYATDGSGFHMYGGPSPAVTGPNGVNVTGSGVAQKDANGNFISKIIVSSTETHWKDTRGIVVLKIVKKTSPNCNGFAECFDYKYQDSSGAERIVTLNYTTQWNVRPNFGCAGISEPTYNAAKLLREIVLPNTQKYVFDYEDGAVGYKTGRVSKVNLPTGGFYEYAYPSPNNGVNCSDGKLIAMDRKIGEQGSGSPSIWQYRRTFFNPDWKTKVTEPPVAGQAANESTFVFDVGGKLKTAKIYQGAELGGTLLRTTNIIWAANGTPFSTTTVLEDGGTPLSSRVETDFDTYGNLLEVRQFDFSNNLVRKTTNTYAVIGLIRDRVTSTTVRDALGNVKAKTEIFYDEPGYINVECPANVPQHDDATHGCSTTARGNPTTIRRWVNASQYIHNSPKYDSLGNVLSITDTAGHLTTLEYGDSWSGPCVVAPDARAFPKRITNHLGHATTLVYNNCTGAVASVTDPNNQTTSFAYDWAGRPTQASRPDGGLTLWHYEDASRYVRTKALRAAGAYVVHYSYFDTLGRLVRQELCEDGADQCTSPVKAEITYDALGRQATVTNPYRSTSDPTYGITRHKYDALHRITRIIPPDGNEAQDSNVVKYAYSGNAHTITDQAGKQRRSFTDALGRLIQMDEPNPTLSTPGVTTYTYDTLDNLLTSVQSGSRQRTFTYDWLSRLLAASHPESGATTYTYQGSGTDSLLQSVTDARGITTTHTYDALHRLLSKSYSDSTLPAYFDYDFATGWSLQNAIGRLARLRTSTNTNTSLFSYDAMGRVILQYTNRPSIEGTAWFETYAGYDEAGNLIWLQYPNGREVTYGYDTASRLNQVRFDSFNGTPVGYNYLSSATYHPHGAPDAVTLGNSLVETLVYNSRVQPCRMNLKSAAPVTLTCTDGAPSGNLADFKSAFNHGTANNGSVISWIGHGTGLTNFNRTFTYDELNRLKTMTGAGGACTGLEWIYDIWGNREEQKVTSGTCPTHNPTILTNNRIAELSYDAAGNVTADGSFNYQWDAESRLQSLNSTGAIYAYDAAGMRVRKAVGSNATEYIYFNGQVIAERSAGGNWTDYVYAGSRLVARSDPVVVRFTNDSCSGCGGNPGGDRNLFVNSITIGSTTILPSDPTVSYTGAPCNGNNNGVGWLLCNGDMISSSVAAGGSITVNAWGSPDYNIYPHMQLWVNGVLAGEWDVTGTAQDYTATATVPGVQYYHADHLGSTRVVTNSSGDVLWSYDYMPFGEGATADYLVNHLFTGHERDPESGLDHTWFRQYSSGQGRWLSPDPLAGSADNPQSLNRYAYVLNDPVNFFDPLGLHQCPPGYDHVVITEHDSSGNIIGQSHHCNPDGAGDFGFSDLARLAGRGRGGYRPTTPMGAEVDPPGLLRSLERFGEMLANAFDKTKKNVTETAQASCSIAPDAVTGGVGGDFGLVGAAGGQIGMMFNGRTGEVSAFVTGTASFGLISADVYGFGGVVPNAPSNSVLNTPSRPNPRYPNSGGIADAQPAVSVGISRTGISASLNHYQLTAGASVLPATLAAQGSVTQIAWTIPYVGYVVNWPRAVCRAATGQ